MSDPAEAVPDTATQPAPESAPVAPARALSGRLWALIGAACLFAAVAGALAARLSAPAPTRFATADLEEVFTLAQLQMTDLVTRKDAGEAERGQAYELAAQFGPRIEAALAAVQADCGCLVLVRGAVARWHGPGLSEGALLIKRVAGVPGDRVTRTDAGQGRWHYYVNGTFAGTAKAFSRSGAPLAPGPLGTLPAGRYYVLGTHPDSLDSRYALAGWNPQARLLGRAYPLSGG